MEEKLRQIKKVYKKFKIKLEVFSPSPTPPTPASFPPSTEEKNPDCSSRKTSD